MKVRVIPLTDVASEREGAIQAELNKGNSVLHISDRWLHILGSEYRCGSCGSPHRPIEIDYITHTSRECPNCRQKYT